MWANDGMRKIMINAAAKSLGKSSAFALSLFLHTDNSTARGIYQ